MNKDIMKAIKVEYRYLSYKLRGEQPFILIDEIKKCGFKSLEEYFEYKKQHLFNQLEFEIIEKSPSECLTEGWRLINEKVTAAFFMEPQETIVFVNTSKPYNKEYCIENNLTIYELPTGGGTIVSGAGDLAVDICLPDNIGIDTDFMLNGVVKILSKYIDNVEIVDNDILVNNNKVCGTTFFRSNEMILFVLFFSFSDNSNLIDIICHENNKPIKTPSYISGLDKNILKDEVILWLSST